MCKSKYYQDDVDTIAFVMLLSNCFVYLLHCGHRLSTKTFLSGMCQVLKILEILRLLIDITMVVFGIQVLAKTFQIGKYILVVLLM